MGFTHFYAKLLKAIQKKEGKIVNFFFSLRLLTCLYLVNCCLWAVNSDECLMTRMQEMSLHYHFSVEQEVGSSTHAFFGFNGI